MSTVKKTDRRIGFKFGFELVCFAVYGLLDMHLSQYIYICHRFKIVLAVNDVNAKSETALYPMATTQMIITLITVDVAKVT